MLPETLKVDPFAIFTMYKSVVSFEKPNGKVAQLEDEIEFIKENMAY